MHWLHWLRWGNFGGFMAGGILSLVVAWLVMFIQAKRDPDWQAPPDDGNE